MNRLPLLALLALAACAHKPADDTPGPLPIAVSCVPAATPSFPNVHTPEQLGAVPDGPTMYALMTQDYLLLFAYALATDPVLQGCRKAAPAN